jgi:acyl transferase domain-containing protein
VIGLGCRFPGGADSPRKFLELLLEGRDAISEVPRDRWDAAAWYDPDPDVPGKINCRHGGFVEGFEGFDAAFFGIAPREARSLDPQHRMLLEVSWEALENAGMAPGELAGANTGVFVGITSHDYYNLVVGGDPHRIDPYLGTGNAHSSASGRLSYFFGFKGPSVSLDTACSSALVAIHSACQSLRTGETDMALAGGVNHLLLPEMSVNFAKAHMLAPDGRCKAFDARANGYVRSEGCGMVVLKRLSTAVAAGDPILAVVRGSAVNQDGRSGGLTVPSRSAQAAVIRRSLSMAGIGPDSVGFVEAHGTGTSLGDPIEVQALQDVFGKRDPGDPLWIGSVKSNLGHLESAAGVASFIKAVLCLQVRDLAPSLHFETPNPHIHWDQMPIKVASRKREWKTSGRRVAGVSSFSFSGTNAHLVLEEAPASAPSLPQEAAPGLPPRVDHGLVLSAQSEAALRDLAGRYAARLAELPPGRCGDLCATAAVFKDCFDHRLFLVKDSADGLRAALASFAAEGECEPPDAVGRIPGGPGQTKVGFIFPDQQLAYPDPGGQLYRGEPVFRQAAGRLAASLEGELKIPLLQTLFPGPEIAPNTERDWRDDPANAHAALYILEFALAELWRSWGVTPEIVLGHGVGEYVAAAVAGVFSPEDGLRMVLARAGLHSEFQREDAKDGPLDRIRPGLTEEQRRRFRAIANLVTYHRPRISLVSGASGRLVDREVAFAEYWERHLQAPVRPDLGRETLDDSQIHEFVEMGPEPFWGAPAGPPKVAGTKAAAFLPSLQPQVAPRRQCIEILGRLFVHGVTVDWPAYYRGRFTRQSQLPTYPFQHQRYWCDSTDQCYRVTWKQQPLPRSPLAADRGRWLILADQDWPELARAFGENGRRSVFVPSGAGSQTGEVTFRAQERYRQLLAEGGPWEGIVYAWQATADWTSGTREIGDFGLSRLVDLTGALAALENPPKLWLTTRGGTSTAAAGLQSPFSAALLGLGRCLFLEHPKLKGGMLDLDMVATKGEAGRVRDELLDPQSEDCVALRENLRFVNRLESARPAAAPALKLSRSGAYLITGGLGALGLQTARHLVDHQAGCVVLMGRGATSDATLKALRPLEQRGSRILVVRGDVTDETAVAAVLETIKANQFELRGIVHAAGVNSRRLVMELEPGQLRGALAPKVAGALNLHRLTAGAPLDFFVCFSSIAAVWGSARQAHYAAANAFLDGLVEYRRARGQKGLAVNWGPWEGDGMSKADGGRRVTESGLRLLGPDLAFVLLDQLLASGESRATVADVDWARLKSLYEVRGRQPLFEKVLGETPPRAGFQTSAVRDGPGRRCSQRTFRIDGPGAGGAFRGRGAGGRR